MPESSSSLIDAARVAAAHAVREHLLTSYGQVASPETLADVALAAALSVLARKRNEDG